MDKNKIKNLEKLIIEAALNDEYLDAEKYLDELNTLKDPNEAIDTIGNFLLDKAIEEAEEQKLNRAEELLKKAQEIDPLNPEVHMNLGRLYGMVFFKDLSIEELWEDRTDEELLAELAIDAFNKSLDLDPENVEAWNLLAIIYEQREMPQKAIEALKESLRIDPEQTSKQEELEELLEEYIEYNISYDEEEEEE
ncbi:MAG: tetratricopeptide repeat protein [Candidatus Coatesbacteria bacterium]|nr:tetratricopeptide repeat protein [Candidatus Coatesbacteria bacterium]